MQEHGIILFERIFMKKLVYIFLSLFVATQAFSISYSTTMSDGVELVLTPVNAQMVELDKFSQNTTMSTVCVKANENVEVDSVVYTKVFLWMQMGNHGHGTSEVEVQELENNCILISMMEFVIRGEWQLHLETENSKAMFKFPVSR